MHGEPLLSWHVVLSAASLHMEEIFIDLYQVVAICVNLGGSVVWKVLFFKETITTSRDEDTAEEIMLQGPVKAGTLEEVQPIGAVIWRGHS